MPRQSKSGSRGTEPALGIRRSLALMVWGIGTAAACGGYYVPTSPTVAPPEPERVTVTIGNDGVSPRVATGSTRVTVEFVNQSANTHDIRSDPHPSHTECVEFNLVGEIRPGHRVAVLTPLEDGRRCSYHDELRPDDERFRGSVRVE